MPIPGIEQPALLPVDDALRLRRFAGVCPAALGWYQDPETVWLVDGVREPYTAERLAQMYRYLDGMGELYWIEALQSGCFVPVGDVTFWQDDLPIVLGEKALRGQGIGRRVIAALVDRARALGWPELSVREIYRWNTGSQRCFEAAGFRRARPTPQGYSYRLDLTNMQ